jgi:tRNA threonylcarbamoyl adenosine modification protein YeaZ/ribosomal-protein-alanine acetyltransferase
MVVLALETVTRAGSIALLADGRCHATVGDSRRTHGERLPGDVTRWLAQHGRTLGDVDRFAVIAGPGSFTGLRIGMAAVQGLALSGGREVVPVPTLDAMATGWMSHASPAAGTVVVACLDGQRGDVFSAAWQVDAGAPVDRRRVVIEPQVGTPDALAADLRALGSGAPVVVVGDGARRYAAAFDSAHAIADVPVSLAEVAARTAGACPGLAVAPHALRPLYIRRPDAVLARERAADRAAHLPPPPRAAATAGFVVSPAALEDLGAVEALQRQTFTNPWAADAMRWELEHTDVARLYVLREPGGTIIGYCACWMVFDELHLNSVAIDVAWRRRGLARTLLKAVIDEAVGAGARSATLEVRQSNEAARALYQRLGFVVEAVRRDYYQQPREDALILWHRRLAGN